MKNVDIQKNIRNYFNNDKSNIDDYKKIFNYVIEKNINNKKSKGFIVIRNLSTENYKKKIIKFAKSIGKLRAQNQEKKIIIKITPKRNIHKIVNQLDKIRYHQTNIGGSVHTDGPQLSQTPKFLIMGCYKNSKIGGDTLISDSEKIYNFLKKKKPILLKELCKNIYFERRGFRNKKINCLKKPIFTKKKNYLIFRYLREYIHAGYKLNGKKISKNLNRSLNYLDKLLNMRKFQKKLKLNNGDLILINNHRFAHGRTRFDLEDVPRLFYRLWVN